jgi:phosphoglycerate dehydrogenase-like enzyme
MTKQNNKFTVFISTPLEQEHVEKIRNVDLDRLEVIYDPNLLPPTRYTADHNGGENFKRTPELEGKWKQHLAKADILFDFPPKSPEGAGGMEYAPNAKWVQTTSSGVGKLVKDLSLQNSDLLVTTASGVHANSLAEFVFMGILNHVRKYSFLKNEQKAHSWERYCGNCIEGKTLAIIGVGRIGRHIAKIGNAFDMKVVGADLMYKPEDASKLGLDHFYPLDQLHDMLREADALVLSVPDTPQTRKMINRETIESLKPGALLINIGRGPVIDEDDMITALRSGKINAAVLDVFQTEPLPADSPLWDMPNVLVSPHSASTVVSENGKITDIFCHNLRCYIDDRRHEMKNILNKELMF